MVVTSGVPPQDGSTSLRVSEADNARTSLQAIVIDITERKARELDLREADQRKDEFCHART